MTSLRSASVLKLWEMHVVVSLYLEVEDLGITRGGGGNEAGIEELQDLVVGVLDLVTNTVRHYSRIVSNIIHRARRSSRYWSADVIGQKPRCFRLRVEIQSIT
ncbi:hypothetical protein PIB30_025208 [Stylosanthes scabra]|uniref:Uncharacterized protein n=1 Tax=Stylosanthes scabra TaxID=79078 RepID=A0ABU6QBD6_9FABA|nr:hypothetical protein [Stylosanthes scabra]